MKELDKRIDAWAAKVGIHDGSTAMKQALYTLSETQELLVAVNDVESAKSEWINYDPDAPSGSYEDEQYLYDLFEAEKPNVSDAIGDIYVTLKNVAHFYGLDMEECVEGAVKIIEDRANRGGGMQDGVYIKPEEE